MQTKILIPAFLSLAGLTAVFLLTAIPTGAGISYEDWPEESRKAIEHMKNTYGEPAAKTTDMVIWYNTGPWKRTIVYKEPVKHDFPMPHNDVIEQTIDYKVPPDKFSELAKYDGSVVCNRTAGEISARCDKEAANVLAINLANDIVSGTKDMESARRFYAEVIKKLIDGESHSYTKQFQFAVQHGKTADPDSPSEIFNNKKMEAAGK